MIYHGTEAVKGSNGWYLVVLGQYGAELVYTGWYWDSIGQTNKQTNEQGKIELLSQWTMEG